MSGADRFSASRFFFFSYLVCNFFFTKEESNADILVSEQVGVAAMALALELKVCDRPSCGSGWLLGRKPQGTITFQV